MTPALGTEGLQYETIDVNIIPDLYVTWIVDIWDGDRDDPAVDIVRYIGVWPVDVLENEAGEAVDPTFNRGRYGEGVVPSIKPIHWSDLGYIKKADSASKSFKKQNDEMMDPEQYVYGSMRAQKDLYISFMNALDKLVEHPDDADAWAAVEAYRNHQAMQHEK